MKKKSIGYHTFFILQVIVLIICYLVYANKIIPPSFFPYFGLIALIYPVLFIIHCIFLILGFCFRKKRNIIVCLLTIPLAITFGNIYKLPFTFSSESSSNNQKIKILTYNAQYAYKGVNSLHNYLQSTQSDIIFLQEIYKRHWRKEALLPENNNVVHDFVGISSRYPILYQNDVSFPNTNAHGCYADIVLPNDTIRVINIYLEPNYIIREDFETTSTDELEQNTSRVTGKLIRGFRIHQWQLSVLYKYINASPYPVIVAGDFNSVPNSYEYYTLSDILTNSFSDAGKGLGTTFHEYHYPLKIDYIFYDKSFKSLDYSVDRSVKLSDHFPISSLLEIIN